jgi:hypothetical protein
MKIRSIWLLLGVVVSCFANIPVLAQNAQDCSKVPDFNTLKATLTAVVKEGSGANGGLANQEWAAVVNRDGGVCAITLSGPSRSAQWPGSRVIAAVKASTANASALQTLRCLPGISTQGRSPVVRFTAS